ncbi:uncharacterized protein EV422DRAFT_506398 [Fimicolochytrium jonesii]|uniref:uncharacterized protein n=1 Tax=Fimicolochytrium jonesii TaxID=1396493 RepID=UPI0022FF28D1|nr:uncharacterized protein EV422DRAFT_506398 [Fimicolochytrium jonesii]KAI8820650.1 hypothetical protein EV422DRAFT_506398 [Fimicolochytrium jonesii]
MVIPMPYSELTYLNPPQSFGYRERHSQTPVIFLQGQNDVRSTITEAFSISASSPQWDFLPFQDVPPLNWTDRWLDSPGQSDSAADEFVHLHIEGVPILPYLSYDDESRGGGEHEAGSEDHELEALLEETFELPETDEGLEADNEVGRQPDEADSAPEAEQTHERGDREPEDDNMFAIDPHQLHRPLGAASRLPFTFGATRQTSSTSQIVPTVPAIFRSWTPYFAQRRATDSPVSTRSTPPPLVPALEDNAAPPTTETPRSGMWARRTGGPPRHDAETSTTITIPTPSFLGTDNTRAITPPFQRVLADFHAAFGDDLPDLERLVALCPSLGTEGFMDPNEPSGETSTPHPTSLPSRSLASRRNLPPLLAFDPDSYIPLSDVGQINPFGDVGWLGKRKRDADDDGVGR